MVNNRTRVKICGITRLEDALLAQRLGADAIGFVFVPKSQRYIEPSLAADIASEVGPFITVVGLFLDESEETVNQLFKTLPAMLPQFHGRESAAYCESFRRPYIKALGVAGELPSNEALLEYQSAQGFLLDSHEPGALGGTGKAFDWQRLNHSLPKPLVVAGGLHEGNVAHAIETLRPQVVDVSSGVESAKGIKCARRMQAFMHAVTVADQQHKPALAV